MKNKLTTILSLALLVGSMGAKAGFVASYGTGSTGSVIGGSLTTDAPVHDVSNPAYFIKPYGLASSWVWGDDPTGLATINFTFDFDLTGYDLATASLAGVWGADNIGSVTLNGNLLSSLNTVAIDNFYTATAFSANLANVFNQGANSLVFSITNTGGAGAFRSSGVITAELAPEPDGPQPTAISAPASLALAGLGLAGLGFNRRRKAGAR